MKRRKVTPLERAIRRAEAAVSQSQTRLISVRRYVARANEQLAQADAWAQYARDILAELRAEQEKKS